jgi:hypothetical protein
MFKSNCALELFNLQKLKGAVLSDTFFNLYCDMLRLLYGEGFLKNKNNLAVACLSQCQKPE